MSKKIKVETGFNANEIKLINEIISEAYNEFINLYEDAYEVDKFKFSICNNDDEKYDLIERELKQIKTELEQIKNPVAGWLEIILSKFPKEDFDIKFENTIQNILTGDYWEKVEKLVNSKTKINSYIEYLDKFYTSSGEKYYNQPILRNVIKYAAILSRKEYLQGFKNENTIIDETKNPPAVTKMQAPVIALFCNSINESELIKKGESESVEEYCKRICKNYNLVYTQRVRQNFNNRATPKNLLKLKELILPAIDKETNNRIIEYLDKKDKSKHNLYA